MTTNERPMYECVADSNGKSWRNDCNPDPVTPPIPEVSSETNLFMDRFTRAESGALGIVAIGYSERAQSLPSGTRVVEVFDVGAIGALLRKLDPPIYEGPKK